MCGREHRKGVYSCIPGKILEEKEYIMVGWIKFYTEASARSARLLGSLVRCFHPRFKSRYPARGSMARHLEQSEIEICCGW